MKPCNIIIEVKGGVVINVYSEQGNFSYILVDHDNLDAEVFQSEAKDEKGFDLSALEADIVCDDLAKWFKLNENDTPRGERLAEIIDREFNQ